MTWAAEQQRRREEANKARSEKARAQNAVSKPQAGERLGLPSSEGTPKRGSATAAALAKEAGVSRPTMGRAAA